MFARRLMLAVAIAATLAGVGALAYLASRPGPEPLPPDTDLAALFSDFGCPGCNVLLITVDTLRADHLPCQGYPKDTAPEICGFGERNLLFANAISGAPSTVPALISMFTGSIVSNEDPQELLDHYERLPTLAEELRQRGYVTGGFTDHHAIRERKRGFKRVGALLEGFDSFVNVGRGRGARTSTELTDELLEWLEQNRGDKLFAWAHYADPNWSYVPPAELARRFGYDPSKCPEMEIGIELEQVRKIEKALTNDEVACLIAMHQGEVRFTDRHLGQVLDRLDALGLEQQTLVIVTATHGVEFLERDRIGHEWTVYDEQLHVPLMLRNPRRPVAGRLGQVISTVSIRDIALGAVDGEPIEIPEQVVARAYHYYDTGAADLSEVRRRPNEFALYLDRMKLILTPRTNRYELFDLRADPRERHNLGVKEAKGSPLYGRLRRWIEGSRVQPRQKR
jgi:arylsulfatase A-like enzyme